jgi:hypothetical protein
MRITILISVCTVPTTLAPELNFLTATPSQVRFDIGVRNFHFEVFLVDSRMATCRGVSTIWWDVYLVSVTAPFTRWFRSTTRTHSIHFPSIVMLLGILTLPTIEPIHITEPLIKSLHEVALLWPISFPRSSKWKFSTLPYGFPSSKELLE